MSDLRDLERKLERAIRQLPDLIADNIVVTGGDGLGLIQNRIQQRGVDEKGVPFKDYTEPYKRFKAGLTKKKIAKAEQRLGNALAKGKPVRPKTLDTAVGIRGKYKGYVDFTLTGEMWHSIKVIEKRINKNKVSVIISADDADNLIKLKANVKTRGEFIKPNAQERRTMQSGFHRRLQKDFKRLIAA